MRHMDWIGKTWTIGGGGGASGAGLDTCVKGRRVAENERWDGSDKAAAGKDECEVEEEGIKIVVNKVLHTAIEGF